MRRLCVYIQADWQPGQAVPWALTDAEAQALQAQGQDVPEHWPAHEVLDVVLAQERVTLAEVTLPPGSQREAERLVPVLLEEQLLAPVEQQFFALGPRQEGNKRWVAVLDRVWCRPLMQFLQTQPAWRSMTAEALLLPAASALWTGSAWCVREEAGLPQWHFGAESPAVATRWQRPVGLVAESGTNTVEVDVLAWWQRPSLPSIQLGQGEFAPRPVARAWWNRWGSSMALLAVLILAWVGQQSVSAWQAHRARLQADHEAAQAFAQALPGVPALDPVLQLEQALQTTQARRQPSDFGVGLVKLARATPSGAVLQQVQYQAAAPGRGGSWVLQVAPAQQQQWEAALRGQGAVVRAPEHAAPGRLEVQWP